MTDEKKCPYCGSESKYEGSYAIRFQCGTFAMVDGYTKREDECYDRELSQVKAERERLRKALESIGSGGHGPYASRAIGVIVSEALSTPEPEKETSNETM